MGFVQLLPALPDAWKTGSVSGLCARGNFELAISWENSQLKEAVIVSHAGALCKLRYGNATLQFKTQKGKTYRVSYVNNRLQLD